jgi:hypothetical protein
MDARRETRLPGADLLARPPGGPAPVRRFLPHLIDLGLFARRAVLAETFIREFSDESAAHGAPQVGAARPISQA